MVLVVLWWVPEFFRYSVNRVQEFGACDAHGRQGTQVESSEPTRRLEKFRGMVPFVDRASGRSCLGRARTMKDAFETVVSQSDTKVLYRIQWKLPSGTGHISFYRGIETVQTDRGKKYRTVEFGNLEKATKWFLETR